eukprot:NODE_7399_length_479_cov_53.134884_g6956_i0.p1 GENE.NODE_7399_length_479_cov_53.134884_g6956_i0~~NODE_7399_length_479_cov_53.134884_g6956_i0.p1  ORF type:complete len:116 (-),score=13.90 NODE_7399_length_479_cov_53.134884_g6956_i0:73-420(-)
MLSDKVVVAQLPPMKHSDLREFEETVPVWGLQRSIRRQQVSVTGAGALLGALAGVSFARSRGNTIWVYGIAALPFGLAGMAGAHLLSQQLFPSVACNKETRFVKRLWWAAKCSEV